MTSSHESYHLEAEQAVLGAILIEPELLKECPLSPEQVTPGRHSEMLKTFQDMDAAGVPIDVLAIAEWHQNKPKNLDKLGGVTYMMELAGAVPTTSNFQYYVSLIVERYQVRAAGIIGTQLAHGMSIPAAIEQLRRVEEAAAPEEEGDIRAGLVKMYDKIESATGKITGIRTGFADLDSQIWGLNPGDFVIVGARPSVGKTAYAINVGLNAAESVNNTNGAEVAIFSAEMEEEKLLRRMAGAVGNIDLSVLKQGAPAFQSEDWRKLTYAMGVISNSAINIYDRPGMDMAYIWKNARKLRSKKPDKPLLIIVDYLQLIVGDKKHNGNRLQEISDISRGLKIMARELGATVIALSQLSRGVEQRQDKRPMMSDLRESGQIEQDADIIQFLYREDYYDKETADSNMIEVINAKQRDGEIGTVKLAFIKEYGKFVNIDWMAKTINKG